MTAQPGRLLAAGTPRRADSAPEADWSMALIILAWAEDHGGCVFLPVTGSGLLECSCGGLAFEVGSPVPVSAAGLPAVAPPASLPARSRS